MASLLQSESRRLYSWWWDSHISPKNSKWLQENLTDMDIKVKAMIKLIEEDADSFARRAEMYYKKRPELMKMVEEFYRAYRALAERYDQATGALRQAHRTMAEAFPNQIPPVLNDESLSSSSGFDMEPHTPEMPAPIRALYDPDDSQKDSSSVPSHFHVIKRSGAYSEENDVLSRRGLKQLNDMFATGEGEASADSHEGRVRKGLHFNEEEGKGSKYKRHDWSRDLHIQDPGGKEDMQSELKRLREEIQNLQSQKTLESERANKAESDLQNLKDNFCKLSSEKEDVVFEYKKSLERISSLETGFSRVQDELKKLNDVLAMEAMKLCSSETRCSQLEKMNQSLQFELNAQGQKLKTLEEEDAQLSTENQNLKSEKLSESERADKAESDVQSFKDSLWKLNLEKEDAILGYKKSFERITSVETEISRVQDELKKLNDVLIIEAMKSSQLEKNNQFLHFELDAQEEKLKTLEEDQSQLKTENLNLQGQIKLDSERADRAESQVQSVKDSLSDLNFEKEAAILQFQQSLERISYLERQLSQAQDDFKKLSDVMILEATKLRSAEDQLPLFEKANRTLQLELDILEQKIRANQEEFSQLSIINENLKSHITTESERADKAETEVQSVQYSLSKLNFEMEAAILQYQHSLERISFLETQISRSQDDFKKLSHEMVTEATKLSSAEERCLQLEKANQSMQLQLDTVEKKIRDHQEENDILKSQIRRESERADTSETEVQSLNDSLHKLSIENEGSILQYQQSLERISYLETQISRAQDDFKKLNDEMIMEAGELSLAQERCLLLEKENQSIQLEVDALEKAKKVREEELEKSNTFLQEEHQQHMEAQLALLSMEKSNSKSQEELKLLDLEIQSTVYKLKDVELRTKLLEEEICKLKDENSTLMEQNFSSTLNIKDLHDEINMLKEIKGNLVDEMGLYLEEKKVLQHEFDNLKEEKTELEQRHQNITSEMQAVRLNTESFQASLRELQDEHADLNEICKKHEDEKLLLLEKLENMEKISEKNKAMEKSLVDANVELEQFREKIKTMEYSFEALHGEVSTHITEKAMLISQVKTIAEDVENLTGKNAFLEEHISVSNLEVEGLMGKLKDLEESFQSLYAQKDKLIDERNTLVSQVNCISQRLENVESWNAELEVKHLNLEREKDLRVYQVAELESFLKLEKQEHEVFIQSSKNQVATLENQILVLREENQVREEEVEVEQQKVMSGLIELFILRSCLRDMKKTILILSKDCQNHLEASRCAEKLVYQLQQEDLIQMEKIETLSEHNEKVKERILLLSRALKMNVECGSEDRAKDEVLLEIILGEIRNLLGSISGANDEIELLHLEKLVVFTILKQTGLHVGDLKMEKQLLEEELEIRMEELLVLKCDKQGLLKRNEQLMEHVQISGHREEEMKADIYKLLAENQSLLRKFDRLREEKVLLEEQNSVILEEAMALEHLYVLFRSFNAESALMLKLFSDDAYCLRGVNTSLVQEIREMNEKLSVLEKESDSCLEEYRNHLLMLQFDLNTSKYLYEELTDQIESGNSLLSQKETELSEKNQKVQSMQEMNEALSRNLECLNEEICGAKIVREELENNIFSLTEGTASRDKEITQIIGKLLTLNSEFEELRSREEQLISRLQQGTNEVDQCEVEMMTLLKDIQISTVTAAIYEEKIFELILEFERLEICAMIQREVLKEEITSRNAYIIELREKLDNLKGENRGLKSHFEAYLPIVMSLQDSVASLEEETISLAGHPAPNKEEKQDNSLVSHHQHDESPLREYSTAMVPAGVLELQKLTGKVGEIQKMIADTAALLENERLESNADLESKMKVIRGVKVKISGPEEAKSKKKHMQMMKDIQLDQVSSSPYGTSVGSYDLTRTETSETDDQMLKLWEAAERDCNGQKQRAPPVALEHDIEAMEEEKSEYPSSELVAEKELSIDRLELSSELVESHQEWSLRIIERLASDGQRLSVLQANMQELESKMESSERSGRPKSLEYDTIKAKLKETEGAILGLIDINSDLTKKAEEFSSSVAEQSRRKGRRLISERARRGSEKIGRLELELQKIQYILLKLEEENNNERAKAVDKRAKVVLSDYLYGRRNGTKKKKGHFCGCIRPKTNSG